MKQTITVILTSFCALFLSCCGCDLNGRTVTYKIEGDASNASVKYHDEYEDMLYESSVSVPWEKTFNIQFRDKEYYGGGARKENYLAYISAGLINNPSFPVKALIYVDGELVQSESTTLDNHQADAYYVVHYCD